MLLATRQRAFSLQTPARYATQLAIRYACHTVQLAIWRSQAKQLCCEVERISLYIFATPIPFSLLLITFFEIHSTRLRLGLNFIQIDRYDVLLIGKPLPNHATIAWFYYTIKRPAKGA